MTSARGRVKLPLNLRPGAQPARPEVAVAAGAPRTRYAIAENNVHIAYQVFGEGPNDLIFIPPFLTNVEIWWDLPIAARFYSRLAEFARVVLIDKRGSGLSDRRSAVETPEDRMDDLRAVMDAVGSKRATIFAASESCAIAILFAATYPDRTAGLILWAGVARFLPAPDYPWSLNDELWAGLVERAESQWGTGFMSEFLLPSRAGEPAIRDWFGRYERASASPGSLAAHMFNQTALDVRALLPEVRHPTLVMSFADDRFVPVGNSRYLASQIPGAKYVELPGIDHVYFSDNPDPVLGEIEEFLTGSRHVVASNRVLATVLVIEVAPRGELSESALRDATEQFVQDAHREFEVYRGNEIDALGNRILATFDGPARAIYCAQSLSRSAQRLGLEIQAGLHTGECEQLDGKIGGIALQVASAVKDLATPGEIAVSSTVRDLVAGSGILFEDRGRFRLPNLEPDWGVLVVVDAKRSASASPAPTAAPKFEAALEKVVGFHTGPLPPLSKRESQVALLLADGLTNRQIAQRLFLSDRTVEWHVEQILSKLDCANRAQVASWISKRSTSGPT